MFVFIEYIIEIFKYYLIMRNILGFKVKDNKILIMISFIGTGIFSYYMINTSDNPLFVFLGFIISIMLLLFSGRIWKIIVTTLWLTLFVSMLDQMFEMFIVLLNHKLDNGLLYDKEIRDCVVGVISVGFIVLIMTIIKRKIGSFTVKFSSIYYIYFIALTIVEGLMVGILGEEIKADVINLRMYVFSIICIAILCINIIVVVLLAISNDGYKQRDILNRENIKLQEKHYMYLRQVNDDIRRFRHDHAAHMQALRKYSVDRNYEALDAYICNMADDTHILEDSIMVNNGLVDAILNQYAFEAKNNGIKFQVIGQLFEECHIEAYDLCIIFSNLLKNAMRAAIGSDEKYIVVEIKRIEKVISIKITNSYGGELRKVDGEYYTTKEDEINHGFGMLNVKKSVEKYDGIFEVFDDNNEFVVYIEM